MATLKDVARLACVDVSTVSRALNNTSYVHPDTKARIFAAVKELSYQPNVLAQGLRQGKRHTIGVVVPPAISDPLCRDYPEHRIRIPETGICHPFMPYRRQSCH